MSVLKSGRAKDLAFVGLLFALVLIFFRALLDPDRVYSSYDFARDFYPSFHWLHLRYLAHQGVFWDQSSGLGDPVFDLTASAYLYLPLRCIVRCLDAVPAVAVCLVAHYFIAALGAFCLARYRGASAEASFVAAVAVGFSGGMVDSTSSFGLVVPLAWFPWMILGLLLILDAEGPLERRSLAGAAVLGLSTGLALLGGHIGMGLCQIYALAAFFAAQALVGPGRLRRLKSSLPAVAAAALIAALLFGGQALAMARVATQAGRGSSYSEADAAAGAMNPVTFVQVILPYLLGRLKDATFLGQSWRFGTNDPQGLALYMGVPAFLLALTFFVSSPWRRSLPWISAWLFLVLYALGNWTPLFPLVFYRLPFLGHLHWAVRAACQCGPLLCVPIALGLDGLLERRRTWPGRAALGLGAVLALLGLAFWAADPWIEAAGRRFVLGHIVGKALHPYPAAFYLDKLSRWLAVMRAHLVVQGAWALGCGLVFLVLVRMRPGTRRSALLLGLGLFSFAELNANLSDYQPTLPRAVIEQKPPSAEKILALEGPGAQPFRSLVWGFGAQLRRSFPQGRFYGDLPGELRNNALLPPALNKTYGLDLCNVYPSADLKRLDGVTGWFRDLNMDPPQPATDLLPRRRLYDLCGAKYFVLGAPLSAPGLTPLMSDPVYLYRNESALPLAYVAENYSDGWSSRSAVDALTDSASVQARWARPALVEGHNVGSGGGGGTVAWRKYTDLEWDLDVDSAGPGVLALSRLYYPGPWKASVDGRPVELLAANGALCALPLKGGRETVRVCYDDPLPARGLALELLGFALAGLALLLALRRGPPYDHNPGVQARRGDSRPA
jgi:hypothetical protein